MRQHGRRLVAAFARRAGDERDQLAIEARFTHQQAGRNGHAHPAVFQHVDSKAGAARGQLASDV